MARVLAVDDSPVIRRLVEVSLGPVGVELLSAGNGADACLALQTDPPDALVLDLGLPDMSGWDVLDFARSQPSLDGLPVIMLTGHDDAQARGLADAHAVDVYLMKPFRPNDLREAVISCLRQSGDEYLGVPDSL